MNLLKKLSIFLPGLVTLFLLASPVSAAAPDGPGPWADSVVSTSQGLMKNGLAVPAIRSNPASALGVAENDTTDGHFYSLGFGGNIVLGFDNGISSGIFVVEATIMTPSYPIEKAKIEVSENGSTWVNAGNVSQDGTVNVPEQVTCAKFVRITDISDPAIMPDDIADGYDVDGAQALGDSCTPQSTSTPTPSSNPGPTDPPSNTTTTTSSVPGFPNAGGPSCTSNGISTIPNIIESKWVGPNSFFISWGPNAGLNNFVIQYGFSNNNLQFSTNVSGFSTTINNLPPNQPVWVRVAATDGCATGTFGKTTLVGGKPSTNTPGFPNTGRLVPLLPNTGIDPDSLDTPWSIPNLVHKILSFFSNVLGKL